MSPLGAIGLIVLGIVLMLLAVLWPRIVEGVSRAFAAIDEQGPLP